MATKQDGSLMVDRATQIADYASQAAADAKKKPALHEIVDESARADAQAAIALLRKHAEDNKANPKTAANDRAAIELIAQELQASTSAGTVMAQAGNALNLDTFKRKGEGKAKH